MKTILDYTKNERSSLMSFSSAFGDRPNGLTEKELWEELGGFRKDWVQNTISMCLMEGMVVKTGEKYYITDYGRALCRDYAHYMLGVIEGIEKATLKVKK